MSSQPTPAPDTDQPPPKPSDDTHEIYEHPICLTLLMQEAEKSAEGKEQLRRYGASLAKCEDAP